MIVGRMLSARAAGILVVPALGNVASYMERRQEMEEWQGRALPAECLGVTWFCLQSFPIPDALPEPTGGVRVRSRDLRFALRALTDHGWLPGYMIGLSQHRNQQP